MNSELAIQIGSAGSAGTREEVAAGSCFCASLKRQRPAGSQPRGAGGASEPAGLRGGRPGWSLARCSPGRRAQLGCLVPGAPEHCSSSQPGPGGAGCAAVRRCMDRGVPVRAAVFPALRAGSVCPVRAAGPPDARRPPRGASWSWGWGRGVWSVQGQGEREKGPVLLGGSRGCSGGGTGLSEPGQGLDGTGGRPLPRCHDSSRPGRARARRGFRGCSSSEVPAPGAAS